MNSLRVLVLLCICCVSWVQGELLVGKANGDITSIAVRASIDKTINSVTITISGGPFPDSNTPKWIGVGFGTDRMAGGYAVILDANTDSVEEFVLGYSNAGTKLASSITIKHFSKANGIIDATITRSASSAQEGMFDFSNATDDSVIPIIYAYGYDGEEWDGSYSGHRRQERGALKLTEAKSIEEEAHCFDTEKLSNPIVRENCLEGSDPVFWDVNGAGDTSIQGFATDISTSPGEKIEFKVKTPSTRYRIDIFRLGYYGGKGARLVSSIRPHVPLPQTQPDCIQQEETLLYDCGTWGVSASWRVPPSAISGLYFARPTREDKIPDGVPRNWRTDQSKYLLDPQHAIPGADPYIPPPDAPHAYGGTGRGKLRNALKEPRASHIWFVVRERDMQKHADILVQTSDATWQAYNGYGGYTTYGSFNTPYTHGPDAVLINYSQPIRRAFKASYNRPLITRDYRPVNMPLNSEYPLIRFLEKNGFSVAYSTCVDSARRGQDILKYKLFVSVGHDEYWSRLQRDSVTRARDAGVHMAFLSGNEVYWKIRWENGKSPNTENDAFRTMVVYKDTQSMVNLDPEEWTGTWRDARPINREGARPENELTGTMWAVNAHRMDALKVPAAYKKLRFWRNTSVAKLKNDETYTTFKGILGHEWDEDIDNGHRPAGLIRMSETTVDNVQYIQDHGATFDTGTGTHHLVMYKTKQGSIVFGAGTVQWVWGLDANHDVNDSPRGNKYDIRVEADTSAPDLAIQQATINLLADMGLSCDTLTSNLIWTEPSKDKTPPKSIIVHVYEDQFMVIASAEDKDGVVAGLEVSFNGGQNFHPATKIESDEQEGNASDWIYRWGVTPGDPHYDDVQSYREKIKVVIRAIDDSGNVEKSHGLVYNSRDEF
eukprot:m.173198 g.173198  ORF g.173198 m.173198 type:complete len:886 (+) comp15384_c0_seq12:174-2831(+)